MTTCGTTPFRNVQPAIDYADSHRGISTNVCVAGGNDCVGATAFAGDLTMRNGISVYGSYEALGWTLCNAITTELRPTLAAGVRFGSAVQSPTVLDFFTIVRPQLPTTTAVTIDGSQEVVLSNLELVGPGAPVNVRGIDVTNGATALLTGLSMPEGTSGYATGLAFGVRVVGSLVSLEDSELRVLTGQNGTGYGAWLEDASGSAIVDTELRAQGIPTGAATLTTSIRILDSNDVEIVGGSASSDDEAVEKYGIDVMSSLGVTVTDTVLQVLDATSTAVGVRAVGSLIDIQGVDLRASVPAGAATGVVFDSSPGSSVYGAVVASGALSTGLSLVGDGTGTLVSGELTATGPAAIGVVAQDCDGSEPEIRADVDVSGSSAANLEGVHSFGDCHPLIVNTTINALGTNATSINGMRCGASGGIASRCAIRGGSIRIENSRSIVGPNTKTVGVSCEAGACEEIRDTEMFGPTQSASSCFRTCATTAFGFVLDSTDAPVARSHVHPGCADRAAAIHATQASSRIENNRLFGGSCTSTLPDNYIYSAGIFVRGGALDVHSNTIDAGGSPNVVATCTSDGVMGGSGSYRNNIFLSGSCPIHHGFAELIADVPGGGGPPSALQNNDFPTTGALYAPASGPAITTIAGVNALPYANVGSNIAVDPAFVAYPTNLRLRPESLCIDAGTTTGAPTDDMDQEPRSATRPDIGADEWGDYPDPCLGVGCSGHGTCVPSGPNASCACDPGYENPSGDPLSCVAITNVCQPNPCQNGGTCAPNGGGFSCTCPPGINGLTCEIPFTSLAAGRDQTCGLRSDGKLACWGDNSLGAASPPVGSFLSISAGPLHSCAVNLAHAVACWGYPSGATTMVPPLAFESIGIGDDHGCGIRADDQTLVCWGSGSGGQTLAPSGTFLSVATVGFHSCGIRTGGTVACWGLTGPDAIFDMGQATPPPGTFQALSLSVFQSCGLHTDGSIECWGQNGFGGGATPPSGAFKSLDIDQDFGCAVRTNGQLACWGTDHQGQSTPPSGTFDAVTVSMASGYHACALRSDDAVLCWGFDHGQPPTGQP